MRTKLFALFLAVMATNSLWAYDFKYGDLYYEVLNSSTPYTVRVTKDLSNTFILAKKIRGYIDLIDIPSYFLGLPFYSTYWRYKIFKTSRFSSSTLLLKFLYIIL